MDGRPRTQATICVSETLADTLRRKYGRPIEFVPNGVDPIDESDESILEELGVERDHYILFASRLVPEKGCQYLIEAWEKAGRPLPLVMAGDSSFSPSYVARIKSMSGGSAVEFPGFVYGARLASLFRNAALFVLPSDLEGLPIVLLEALGYGVPVLASDIPPNREVMGGMGRTFVAGDVGELRHRLLECLAAGKELKMDAGGSGAHRYRLRLGRGHSRDISIYTLYLARATIVSAPPVGKIHSKHADRIRRQQLAKAPGCRIGQKDRRPDGGLAGKGNETRIFVMTTHRGTTSRRPAPPTYSSRVTGAARFAVCRDLLSRISRWRPDVVYLRYCTYQPGFRRLYALSPVVVEVDADDTKEIRFVSRTSHSTTWFRGRWVLSPASGIACVTNELAESGSFAASRLQAWS